VSVNDCCGCSLSIECNLPHHSLARNWCVMLCSVLIAILVWLVHVLAMIL